MSTFSNNLASNTCSNQLRRWNVFADSTHPHYPPHFSLHDFIKTWVFIVWSHILGGGRLEDVTCFLTFLSLLPCTLPPCLTTWTPPTETALERGDQRWVLDWLNERDEDEEDERFEISKWNEIHQAGMDDKRCNETDRRKTRKWGFSPNQPRERRKVCWQWWM